MSPPHSDIGVRQSLSNSPGDGGDDREIGRTSSPFDDEEDRLEDPRVEGQHERDQNHPPTGAVSSAGEATERSDNSMDDESADQVQSLAEAELQVDGPKSHRNFTLAYKLQVVSLALRIGRNRAADTCNVPRSAVSRWMRTENLIKQAPYQYSSKRLSHPHVRIRRKKTSWSSVNNIPRDLVIDEELGVHLSNWKLFDAAHLCGLLQDEVIQRNTWFLPVLNTITDARNFIDSILRQQPTENESNSPKDTGSSSPENSLRNQTSSFSLARPLLSVGDLTTTLADLAALSAQPDLLTLSQPIDQHPIHFILDGTSELEWSPTLGSSSNAQSELSLGNSGPSGHEDPSSVAKKKRSTGKPRPEWRRLQYCIRDKTMRLVGSAELRPSLRCKTTAEMQFYLHECLRGNSLMPRVIRRLCDFGFASPWSFERIAVVFATNKAGARAVEKAGFRNEGLLRSFLFKEGFGSLDCFMYSLLKSDEI
ncbi:hypothetical protein DFJ73DRAFT_107297 [Zopfochytrium polystomum]|nr:hypothetical protein DFJ73DRAFT_107297 [Zopfochytrium polystomum]